MPLYRLLLVLPALCMLAGCADNFVPKSEPSFYRNLAQPGAQLDAGAAASMISGYRANNGLPAVELDSDLMPGMKVEHHTVACRTNPLGVKGTGEAGTTAAPPAVMNAIIDALPKGTRLDMPATSERIWQALRSSRQ